MPLDEPSWWYRSPEALIGKLLLPIASVYNSIAAQRLRQKPQARLPIPVICIGNFTAGGTGKTPMSIWLANYVKDLGLNPVFLSRGYGGSRRGPHLVQPGVDLARDVGDEPLLLAETAPAVISRDRGLGGQFIHERQLGNVILMDDGLQNPSLKKDLVISVVSAARGVGNGKVIPAGPLRASLAQQLAVTDVVVINYDADTIDDKSADELPAPDWLPRSYEGLVASVTVVPRGDHSWLADKPVVAFAGIGNPDRFYKLIRQHGGVLQEMKTFPDHHPLTDKDAKELLALAHSNGCQLVTTEKDLARLDPRLDSHSKLRLQSRALAIELMVLGFGAERLKSKIRDTVGIAKG
ncbi:MAG: tetraacyldisaccharide 4'-kinase [Pseudomonadota bacterium]